MKYSVLAFLITLTLSPVTQATPEFSVMKATSLSGSEPEFDLPKGRTLSDYWVSEKLDGIRAHWTGKQLLTRSGHPIAAPLWFTESLPGFPLEGELWAGRENYPLVMQTVLDRQPNDSQWRQIQFMIFDAPAHDGTFGERHQHFSKHVAQLNLPHLKVIPQQKVDTALALDTLLSEVEKRGGEGLMLHWDAQRYQHGKTDGVLKLKRFEDAEAMVMGYEPGKGKYRGMMGAIWVKMAGHPPFKIGSGFTDADRLSPPAVGSRITFRHNGYTSNQIPRFARFLRVRPDGI
ncbi:DNA ligase (plasmid) [Photobacterium sp. GJ3]|uniref:DNA ligase n=1 Tax=Photobacterium sp. GJ3 TaxID=2829502 RepID=UPI001B8B0DAA|nr:DNA ligase [Photobacterium sp. GJ3]QUJ70284.1 DNA ligase [Photobacterium sp. GJ3]